MSKPEINIVWLKRDYRLLDHLPLKQAIEDSRPTLLIGFLEPSLINAPQSDDRHWRFIYESYSDLQEQLKSHNQQLYLIQTEVLEFFTRLTEQYQIKNMFSHEETGIQITYDRDKAIAEFCKTNGINWIETPTGGVIRGIKKRNNWPKHWYSKMASPVEDPEIEQLQSLKMKDSIFNDLQVDPKFKTRHTSFQEGGERKAKLYLRSFFQERVNNYNKHISKPEYSRKSCSRLSAYLAWGNLSMRQVYQAGKEASKNGGSKRNIQSFLSRLRWHCHFIQKFEMMDRYEYMNINPAYNKIRDEWSEEKFQAWKTGNTGYPLIDACMRCLIETGYLNFRMRSMLVSFLTHHLWLDWKRGADYMASLFLDFEPGIHYPQFQMQAGTTGYNTVRIYNPIKQSEDNDPDAAFISKWVPVLKNLPLQFKHKPWTMTAMEENMYGVKIGEDYPFPIVDVKQTYKEASKNLWSIKNKKHTREEARKILALQNEEERVESGGD